MPKELQRVLLTSLLVALIISITSPAEILLTNIAELSYGASYHWRRATLLVLGITFFLFLLFSLAHWFSKSLFRFLEALVTSVAVLLLLNKNILYGDYGAFDGRGLSIEPLSLLSVLQVAVAVALVTLLWRKQQVTKVLIPVIAIYTLTTLSLAAFNFRASGNPWNALLKHPFPVEKAFFQFSATETNYLYILLDEVYGGSAMEILRSEEGLADSFEGFTFYSNVAGIYPTTIVSVPAILGGELYRNKQPVRDYLAEAFSNSSLLNLLKDREIETFIHSSGMYCSHLPGVACSDMGDMLPSEKAAAAEYGEILDIAMFAMLPDLLKPLLYQQGNWTFRRIIKPIDSLMPTSFQVQEFEFFINEMTVGETASSFKFYHNTVTHSPVKLDRNCTRLRTNLPPVYSSYLEQDRCGFALTAKLLDKLRELGVYDNTFIVVSSDHGRPFVSDHHQDLFDNSPSGASYKQYGYAHAILLVKPPAARDKLAFSREPRSLLDVGGLFTDAVGTGEPGAEAVYKAGARPFYYYDWGKPYFDWRQSYLPPFEGVYFIGQDITNPDDWREDSQQVLSLLRNKLQRPLPCDFKLGLSDPELQTYYLPDGLSSIEPWGRWSDGSRVRIYFRGDSDECRQRLIKLDLQGFVRENKPRQFAEVYFNETRIGEVSFDLEGDKHKQVELALEPGAYRVGDVNTIELRIDAPVSPARLGINNDTRKLAIGMKSISLH